MRPPIMNLGRRCWLAPRSFFEFSPSAVQLERETDGLRSLNRTLDCSKIRNTFAVRQIPWRSAIGDVVKQYYEKQQG